MGYFIGGVIILAIGFFGGIYAHKFWIERLAGLPKIKEKDEG